MASSVVAQGSLRRIGLWEGQGLSTAPPPPHTSRAGLHTSELLSYTLTAIVAAAMTQTPKLINYSADAARCTRTPGGKLLLGLGWAGHPAERTRPLTLPTPRAQSAGRRLALYWPRAADKRLGAAALRWRSSLGEHHPAPPDKSSRQAQGRSNLRRSAPAPAPDTAAQQGLPAFHLPAAPAAPRAPYPRRAGAHLTNSS